MKQKKVRTDRPAFVVGGKVNEKKNRRQKKVPHGKWRTKDNKMRSGGVLLSRRSTISERWTKEGVSHAKNKSEKKGKWNYHGNWGEKKRFSNINNLVTSIKNFLW